MLRLTTDAYDQLIRAGASAPHEEVCGLVWGNRDGQRVVPLRNTHPDPSKYYSVEAGDLQRAYEAMDHAGGEPLAFYHSHPSGRSDPSETDMQGAFNVGMYYLILYPETQDLMARQYVVKVGMVTTWKMSAWECIEPGILVAAEWTVA
jgi:desampylase